MAVRPVIIYNFARSTLADIATTVGAEAARNTSSPVSGSADLILQPGGGSGTWNTAVAPFGLLVPTFFTARKLSIAFPFKFAATPANSFGLVTITSESANVAYITTARKILWNSNTSTVALTANTVYWMNIIIDKDWVAPGSGAVIFNIYDSSYSTQIDTMQVNVTNPNLNFNFGEINLKSVTRPNTTIQIGSTMLLYDNSGYVRAPYLRNPSFQTIRVPTAVGSDNDGIGVSEATNKHQNIDEDPSSSSDYVHQGQMALTEKQTFQLGTATYGSTPRAYSVHTNRYSPGGQSAAGDIQVLNKHSGVEELINDDPGGTNGVVTVGGDKLVSDTALSTTNLDDIRVGYRSNITVQNYNSGQLNIALPTADGATYDGVFVLTGGTAGSAFTTVDEPTTGVNTADYLTSGASGDKQGFMFTVSMTPAVPGDIFKKLVFRITHRNFSGSSGSFIKIIARQGSTEYESAQFLAGASLTVWDDETFELELNGSFDNPFTGQRWTKAQIEATEFIIHHFSKGTGDYQLAQISIGYYGAKKTFINAMWMNVALGDAFTENGGYDRFRAQILQ